MPTFDDKTIEQLFGAEDAENEDDERFRQYFFFNRTYENLLADLPIRILVGHKGIGKSALLRRAYLNNIDDSQLAVWIRPNDLVPMISEASKTEFNQQIENWKLGLLSAIGDKAVEDIFKGNQIKDQTTPAKTTVQSLIDFVTDISKEKFSNITDATRKKIVEKFLKREEIFIYIDDIDRGWSASEGHIRNISALLNAIRDLAGADKRLKFRIGLRSDVYYLVRTSDESTDKIERHVIWLTWTNHEILSVMAKRIETFFDGKYDQDRILKLTQADITKNILSKVMTPVFEGEGHWSNRPIHNVLLSLTRKRPRDLVKLTHGSAKNAFKYDNQIISSGNIESTFEPYSNERLQDVINEFKTELPSIDSLLLSMRQTKKERRAAQSFLYTTDSLVVKLKEIIAHTNLHFTNNRPVTPKSLIQFLFKIDFITARLDKTDKIDRKYFDQSRFLANEIVDFGYEWEVHPAYRWALQPQDMSKLLNSIDI